MMIVMVVYNRAWQSAYAGKTDFRVFENKTIIFMPGLVYYNMII